jgi:NAD(P)-dependent dehydrogenase (short-subunit alcohol dehydrogenase family)
MSAQPRIALVTGAGSGIGRVVTHALLADGYSVALAGRRREPLDETVAQSGADDTRVLVMPTDVADPDAVRALFDATAERFGRLDVLFNNAGIFVPGKPFDEIPFEDWTSSLDVNLTGYFLCTQHAFRIMKAQDPKGGRIINNGSISAHAPRPKSVPYTTTKHAITGLTKCTSLDGREHDIACGQIDIGNAATEMTEKFAIGVPQADGSTRPEPRMDLEHVGTSVLYMANLPLDTNVQFMTIMATKMPFVGRG